MNDPPRTILGTWRQIGRRWFVPIVALGVPIILTQFEVLAGSLDALLGVVGILAGAVLVAPLAWRVLFPPEARGLFWLRGAAFVATGVVNVWVAMLYGMGVEGLAWAMGSLDPGFWFGVGVYCVTGYGLARDLDMEESIQRERARAIALEKAAQNAELMALRSHLDPHFLFNTLNAIAEWCREDPAVAEQALLRLSTMLRTLLQGIRSAAWPLADEVAMVQDLGALYALRDPHRFALGLEGLPAEGEVPPMLLLSLVENAFKHGPGKGHEGAVLVRARREGENLLVEVENPGPFGGRRPGGEGLDLVERRLEALYGPHASFSIEGAGERTVARLRLPAHPPEAP